MFFIAHRGNINGPNAELENRPAYLLEALDKGFDVETDVWKYDDKFYLGHDSPDYEINIEFLKNKKIWCHAKNIGALLSLLELDVKCFWHQDDDYTLTSDGYVWAYPGRPLEGKSICVMPEGVMDINNIDQLECCGICSDVVGEIRDNING